MTASMTMLINQKNHFGLASEMVKAELKSLAGLSSGAIRLIQEGIFDKPIMNTNPIIVKV